jgi:hypothetical protein
MPLDPETNPKAFLTVAVAAGLLIFWANIFGAEEAFKVAEQFVTEAERRVGKLNP